MKIDSRQQVGAFTGKDSCSDWSTGFSPRKGSWGMPGKVVERDRDGKKQDKQEKTTSLDNSN